MKPVTYCRMGAEEMLRTETNRESRSWKLPGSTWALPAITGLLVLLAVAAALA
jgi:hypothetical protein